MEELELTLTDITETITVVVKEPITVTDMLVTLLLMPELTMLVELMLPVTPTLVTPVPVLTLELETVLVDMEDVPPGGAACRATPRRTPPVLLSPKGRWFNAALGRCHASTRPSLVVAVMASFSTKSDSYNTMCHTF